MLNRRAYEVEVGDFVVFDGMRHKVIAVTKETITHIVYIHTVARIPQVRYLNNDAIVSVIKFK